MDQQNHSIEGQTREEEESEGEKGVSEGHKRERKKRIKPRCYASLQGHTSSELKTSY